MTEERYKIGPEDIDTYPKAVRYLTGSILRLWLGLLVFDGFIMVAIMGDTMIRGLNNAGTSEPVFKVICVGSGLLALGFAVSFLVFKAPKYAFRFVCFSNEEILIERIVGSSEKIVDSLSYSEIVEIFIVKGSFMLAPDQLYKKGALLTVILYKRGQRASLPSMLPIGPKSEVQIDEITDLIQAKNPRVTRRLVSKWADYQVTKGSAES